MRAHFRRTDPHCIILERIHTYIDNYPALTMAHQGFTMTRILAISRGARSTSSQAKDFRLQNPHCTLASSACLMYCVSIPVHHPRTSSKPCSTPHNLLP